MVYCVIKETHLCLFHRVGRGKHTICLYTCSFLMLKKGKQLQFQLLLALCFQIRLVSWLDGALNEAAKYTIKASWDTAVSHVPTVNFYFRKQTLKEKVPDLFNFL